MAAWLGLFGALLGAAIGGFATYKVSVQQHQYARRAEARRRRIEAMEALYGLLSSSASFASTLNMGVIGDLGYNIPFKADSIKEKLEFERLRMLVDFYMPSLKPDIEAMSQQLTIVGKAIAEVVLEKNRTDEWKTNTVKDAMLASIEMQRLATGAQTKLSNAMQNISNES